MAIQVILQDIKYSNHNPEDTQMAQLGHRYEYFLLLTIDYITIVTEIPIT